MQETHKHKQMTYIYIYLPGQLGGKICVCKSIFRNTLVLVAVAAE